METFSALLAICAGNSPVPDEFPRQRPVTRSFDVFFDLRLNKRLSKQWWYAIVPILTSQWCPKATSHTIIFVLLYNNIFKPPEHIEHISTNYFCAVNWFYHIYYNVLLNEEALKPSGAEARTLQWRNYEHDGVSNHKRLDCLLNRLFRRRSKKTSKLRVSGLCEGKSPVTCEFPAHRASNAENTTGRDFKYLRHINVDKRGKTEMCRYVF